MDWVEPQFDARLEDVLCVTPNARLRYETFGACLFTSLSSTYVEVPR